jgi:hypothetical protein
MFCHIEHIYQLEAILKVFYALESGTEFVFYLSCPKFKLSKFELKAIFDTGIVQLSEVLMDIGKKGI